MIDFNKLMDPQEQKAAAARREADEAEMKRKDDELREKIDLCIDNVHVLSASENSFARSIRHAILTHKVLSEKQQKYLDDICKRLESAPTIIMVTQGIRGHFAVLMQVHGDDAGPINSGIGSYATANAAFPEAQDWAVSEGIPVLFNHRESRKQEIKPLSDPTPVSDNSPLMESVSSVDGKDDPGNDSGVKRLKFKFRG